MAKVSLPPFTTFGELLRYLRRRARLTQRDLSIATGYSESQISRLEQNERLPDGTTLLARFVPALALEGEPETVEQLLALAASARSSEATAFTAGDREIGDQQIADDGFPLTAHGGPPKSNLLPRLTSLVGREAAVAALVTLLTKQRLVTLTGTGGVGKSSLSQVVGSRLVENFADGVWLVELAALDDPERLAQIVAALFRLPEQSERTPLEALTTFLQQKHLLLILDNCEHLVEACAHLANHLHHTCLHLHILATSREVLRVAGEIEWPVPPLDVPNVAAVPTGSDDPSEYSAVQLFIERARAVRPESAWRTEKVDAGTVDAERADTERADTERASPEIMREIAHICAQLDGIPLAIELAAARLKAMTVQEVAARLDDRLRLLSGGARSAPTRHQTLRAAIDWSYGLLTAPERALLRRLSLFSGGWSLDAAEAIAAVPALQSAPILDALDVLLQLVNKSLVVVETRGAATRYRLLETIRQYAAEKLLEAGETEAIQARHFGFFLQLAEQWREVAMDGRRFVRWLDRLDLEMENVRAAYRWSRERGDGMLAVRLAGALWPFWFNRGRMAEGRQWLEQSLAAASNVPPAIRARALVGLAVFSLYGTTAARTIALAEEVVRLCGEVGDPYELAYAHFALAEGARNMGDFARSERHYTQATGLFRKVGWLQGLGRTLAYWASMRVQSGRSAEVMPLYEECLAIGQQVQERSLISYALEAMMSIDLQRIKTLCRQELRLLRASVATVPAGSRYELEALAALLESFGRSVFYGGTPQEIKESVQTLEECLSIWQTLGIQWSPAGGTARAHLDLGRVHLLTGEYHRAVYYTQRAVRLYEEVGDLHGVACAQGALGWAALEAHDFELATSSFRTSLAASPDASNNCIPRTLAGMAELARRQGDVKRAGRLYAAALHYNLQDEPLHDLPAVWAVPTYRDEPHFAAGWAEGEAMTLAQAVAYALESERNSV